MEFDDQRISGNPTIVCTLLLFSVGLFWFAEIARRGWSDPGKAIGVLGTFVAAIWTLYLFLLKGSFETSFALDLTVETKPKGDQHVVFLQVKLDNIGGSAHHCATNAFE